MFSVRICTSKSCPAGPKIVVVQDLDKPETFGSFWGEVNSSIHKALGCVGTITDGAIRDLDEMRAVGYKAIARRLCVGHAYTCPVRWGCAVEVFGRDITRVGQDDDGVHPDRLEDDETLEAWIASPMPVGRRLHGAIDADPGSPGDLGIDVDLGTQQQVACRLAHELWTHQFEHEPGQIVHAGVEAGRQEDPARPGLDRHDRGRARSDEEQKGNEPL